MTTPALSASRDSAQPPRPPKVRFRGAAALFEPVILRRAAAAAVRKLDPRVMIHIPVMFVVEIGSVITTIEFIDKPSLFVGLVTFWLWATVLFANFAEAVAEGRDDGAAQDRGLEERGGGTEADLRGTGRNRLTRRSGQRGDSHRGLAGPVISACGKPPPVSGGSSARVSESVPRSIIRLST